MAQADQVQVEHKLRDQTRLRHKTANGLRTTTGPDPPDPPKNGLLIWADTRNGIAQHGIGHAMAVIEELGYKSGLYDTYIRTDSNIIARRPKMTTGEPASGGPSLCNVDAIFFLGHREIELELRAKQISCGSSTTQAKVRRRPHRQYRLHGVWPEFGEILGGRFDEHPWGIFEAPLIVTDPKFPGMKAFGPGVDIKDEIYQTKDFSGPPSCDSIPASSI